MGKLTSGMRNDLPASDFGLPSERKYPMPDASHAEDAKARAAHQFDIGGLSHDEYRAIVAKANGILGQSK